MERTPYASSTVPLFALTTPPTSSAGKTLSEFPFKASDGLQSPVDSPSQQHHQRFVLADPVAFSYLEEDRHAIVLERSRQLQGYQTYIVEQWACSRSHPTFVIIAYTGDPLHVIKVGVLSVPADEESWSPRMRVYFKSLAQYHARRKDTPLGTLMVTNLSTFPSSLTIVHIPDGDLRNNREAFFVAENLKRFGCSGRVGLSIAGPTSATQAKFYQLYKISEKINLNSAVIELVKLCQVSLNLFGCLGPEYADGLLCDITEAAVNDWWAQVGSELYNVEPSDGVLGPTTVSALLGTLIGARNRLNAYGAPVTKDVFDLETTKRAVAYFQKTQHLRRTRRLDRVTLYQLHKATAKQASGDGSSWGVPRAVKSTVAELSGKGGEMVLDFVGRADKANIAEIETVDIERFAQLVKGERAKWLWHGKARKRTTRDMFEDIVEEAPPRTLRQNGDQLPRNSSQVSRLDTFAESRNGPLPTPAKLEPILSGVEGIRPDMGSKQGTFRRAKEGLKGVVGRRAIHPDDGKAVAESIMMSAASDRSAESLEQLDSEAVTPEYARKTAGLGERPHPHDPDHLDPDSALERVSTSSPRDSKVDPSRSDDPGDPPKPIMSGTTTPNRQLSMNLRAAFEALSVENDLPSADVGPLLRRTQSVDAADPAHHKSHNENWWPRALSFSTAEDSVLPFSSLDPAAGPQPSPLYQLQTGTSVSQQQRQKHLRAALAHELQSASSARRLRASIADLSTATATHVATAITSVEDLDVLAAQDAEQLNHLYYPRKDEFAALQADSRGLLADGTSRLQAALRDLEALGQKLEYDISALKGKVEDVEGAVVEFGRQVSFAEGRVRELVSSENRDSWFTWMARTLLGFASSGGGAGVTGDGMTPLARASSAAGPDVEGDSGESPTVMDTKRQIAVGAN